jgi:hypothetical protein
LKEGLPGLQRSIPPRHHVDRNRGLGDLDAELEQFTIDLGGTPQDLGGTPQRVLKTHSSDEIAYLFADPGSVPRRTRLPAPVGAEAHSMPPAQPSRA